MENTISKSSERAKFRIYLYYEGKTIPYKEEMRNILELCHKKGSFH